MPSFVIRAAQKISFRSIRTRLVLVFSTLIAVICLFILIYFPKKLQQQVESATLTKAKIISGLTASSIGPALYFEDQLTMLEIIENSRKDKDLAYLVVVSSTGEIAAAHNDILAENYDFLVLQADTIPNFKKNIFQTATPIMINDDQIGTLYMGLWLTGLKIELRRSRINILGISAILFVLGLLVVFGLSALLTRPLQHVVDAAYQISEGDLNTRAKIESQDEIGRLAQAFNHMVDRLEDASDQQEQLLREVESINTELKSFAYVVSHDLKAPLRSINSLTHWLVSDYRDKLGKEGQELMTLLDGRVHRMQNLIEGILQYSQVGRKKEAKVAINLNQAIQNVIDLISLPENFNVTIQENLPTVFFEPTRLEQLFQNLFSNAIKYCDKPQGLISVNCEEHFGRWQISVKDNGPGIDEKYHEKIFGIFQTLNARDEFESTGVGLALVKKIVEMYDGSVWLESDPGEGTTFFFTLPQMPDADKKSGNEDPRKSNTRTLDVTRT